MGDASDDIMAATYRALCEHGYADLTMQRIADESDLSKAALHYHYDTKEELLRAFLDHLIGRLESRLASEAANPRERLDAFLDAVYEPAERDAREEFPTALLEIKAQAPYDAAYRERLQALDERMRTTVADTVSEGVESGQFAEVDPERVAHFVVTLINGGHSRGVALDEPPAESRDLVEAFLDATLAPDGDGVAG